MPQPISQTTGRRKQAVARVRFRPGDGVITINNAPSRTTSPRLPTAWWSLSLSVL